MKKYRLRGAPAQRIFRCAVSKIIVNKADSVGIETSNVLAATSLYIKLFCIKQPYLYGCAQAPLLYGSFVGNVLYNINNIKADILYFIFIIVFLSNV